MARPAVFSDGLVTAGWGSAAEDRYILTNGGTPTPGTGVCFDRLAVNIRGGTSDITQFTSSPATAVSRMQGLYRWEVEMAGLWPRATQLLGNSGAVTFSAGYTTHVLRYDLTIEAETHEWVPMSTTAVKTPYFMPGRVSWSGTYEALVDITTDIGTASLPVGVTEPAGTGAAATFTLTNDGSSLPTFTGNIIITDASPVAQKGSQSVVSFSFEGSGALTYNESASLGDLLPNGAVDTPDWDSNGDGVPDGNLVAQFASGRTFTGPAFWKRINVRVDPSTPIAVSVTAQGAGALTIA